MSKSAQLIPVAPPRLLAPLEGTPVDYRAAVFRWEATPHGAGYELQVGADPAFIDRWFQGEIGWTDIFTLLETLPGDETTFYWRVRHVGGEWSDTASFRASEDEQVTSHDGAHAPAREVQEPVRRREVAGPATSINEPAPIAEADDPVDPPYLTGATSAVEAGAFVAVILLMMAVMGFIAVTVGL